jgi:hypothetical protein
MIPLANGQTQQMQIVNPGLGESETYNLLPGQRLHVVPAGMGRYVLDYDPALMCLNPPVRVEQA